MVVKIVSIEAGLHAVTLHLDRPGIGLWGHGIVKGILEERQVAWELPDDIEPLDVLLTDAYAQELPDDPFSGDFQAKRAVVLDAVRKHGPTFGGRKAEAAAACRLPAEDGRRLKARLAAEFTARRARGAAPRRPLSVASQAVQDEMKQIRLGYERLGEERLAEEFVSVIQRSRRGVLHREAGAVQSVAGSDQVLRVEW